MNVGMFIPRPKNETLSTRFPVVIEGDIPFLLYKVYLIAGVPERPEAHVEYFQKHGVMRREPLSPTSEPLMVLNSLAKSPDWPFGGDDNTGRAIAGSQLLRLMQTVYTPSPDIPRGWRMFTDPVAYKRLFNEARRNQITWDHSKNIYTFTDGSDLKGLGSRQ